MADLRPATIVALERGGANPRLATLEALARAFDVTPASLLRHVKD